MRIIPRLIGVAIASSGIAQAPQIQAQTDEIQVYDAAIAPTGAFNLTLHNNFTPGGERCPGVSGCDRCG